MTPAICRVGAGVCLAPSPPAWPTRRLINQRRTPLMCDAQCCWWCVPAPGAGAQGGEAATPALTPLRSQEGSCGCHPRNSTAKHALRPMRAYTPQLFAVRMHPQHATNKLAFDPCDCIARTHQGAHAMWAFHMAPPRAARRLVTGRLLSGWLDMEAQPALVIIAQQHASIKHMVSEFPG
jgi:hypothetical protein